MFTFLRNKLVFLMICDNSDGVCVHYEHLFYPGHIGIDENSNS